MGKTSEKIILSAIELFNDEGVNKVRLQDIASHADISAGNLAYHFKLKKDLIEGVLQLMSERWENMRRVNLSLLEQDDYIEVTKAYIIFQMQHRFFYRDILDIVSFKPDVKDLYRTQIHQVVKFIENGIYLSVGKGYILSEPHDGHYRAFAKNAWAILNSAFTERAVFGKDEVPWEQAVEEVWEFHYPYFTEKGRETFYYVKEHLSEIVSGELSMLTSIE